MPAAPSLAQELLRVASASPIHRITYLCADPERLVGPAEASEITGLAAATLAVYRCTGRLKAATPCGAPVRYRVGDLRAYVAKMREGGGK